MRYDQNQLYEAFMLDAVVAKNIIRQVEKLTNEQKQHSVISRTTFHTAMDKIVEYARNIEARARESMSYLREEGK